MDEPNLLALCPRDRAVLVVIEGYDRLPATVRAVIEGHIRDDRWTH